jgi:type II secretion system protein G
MLTFRSNKKSGFTLIELLVVISIISLLSSVVLSSLNSARSRARDTQRMANIRSLQTALELYFDANGKYPTSADLAFPGVLTAALTPAYISKIPTDPGSGTFRYYTASQDPATFYAIYMPFETKTICYVCAGTSCGPNAGWWGINICQ